MYFQERALFLKTLLVRLGETLFKNLSICLNSRAKNCSNLTWIDRFSQVMSFSKPAFQIRIRIHPDPLHLAGSGSGSTSIPALDPDPDPDPLRFLASDPDPDPLKKALIWIRVAPNYFRVKSKTKCFCYLRNAFYKFWR